MSFLISELDFRHLFRAIFQLDLWIKFDSHILILLFCFPQAGVAKRLIPLLDRILIQRAEALTKSKGGIVIPEKAQSKVLEGTVIAVGPGARNTVSKWTLSTPPAIFIFFASNPPRIHQANPIFFFPFRMVNMFHCLSRSVTRSYSPNTVAPKSNWTPTRLTICSGRVIFSPKSSKSFLVLFATV